MPTPGVSSQTQQVNRVMAKASLWWSGANWVPQDLHHLSTSNRVFNVGPGKSQEGEGCAQGKGKLFRFHTQSQPDNSHSAQDRNLFLSQFPQTPESLWFSLNSAWTPHTSLDWDSLVRWLRCWVTLRGWPQDWHSLWKGWTCVWTASGQASGCWQWEGHRSGAPSGWCLGSKGLRRSSHLNSHLRYLSVKMKNNKQINVLGIKQHKTHPSRVKARKTASDHKKAFGRQGVNSLYLAGTYTSTPRCWKQVFLCLREKNPQVSIMEPENFFLLLETESHSVA